MSICFLKISICILVDGYLFSSNLWYIKESVPKSLGKYLLLFSTALEFVLNNIKMNSLIIDAAKDKILFKIITEDKSYTSEYSNSRENFDKFAILLFKFLHEHNIKTKDINNIFINQGPGKFSSIRSSIATAKALKVTNKLDLYGFNTDQAIDQNYNKILDLYNKGFLIKNLIKPQYSS